MTKKKAPAPKMPSDEQAVAVPEAADEHLVEETPFEAVASICSAIALIAG